MVSLHFVRASKRDVNQKKIWARGAGVDRRAQGGIRRKTRGGDQGHARGIVTIGTVTTIVRGIGIGIESMIDVKVPVAPGRGRALETDTTPTAVDLHPIHLALAPVQEPLPQET
jgi:hypothetical protein